VLMVWPILLDATGPKDTFRTGPRAADGLVDITYGSNTPPGWPRHRSLRPPVHQLGPAGAVAARRDLDAELGSQRRGHVDLGRTPSPHALDGRPVGSCRSRRWWRGRRGCPWPARCRAVTGGRSRAAAPARPAPWPPWSGWGADCHLATVGSSRRLAKAGSAQSQSSHACTPQLHRQAHSGARARRRASRPGVVGPYRATTRWPRCRGARPGPSRTAS
jgi:hypothetical protein